MTRVKASAVLFDLDGTLADSTAVIERVWREWAVRHGVNAEDLLAVSHGRPAIDTMRQFRPDLPDLEEQVHQQIAAEERDVQGIVPIAGALEFIASLPLDRWAIVTSCPTRLAAIRREAAGVAEPPVVITADDVELRKPAPDCFLLAARKMGLDAHTCVVVEDSPAGIKAGLSAGMRVLGLTTTHSAWPLQPTWIRPDLRDIRVSFEQNELTLELPGSKNTANLASNR